jgi:hypothetical protein
MMKRRNVLVVLAMIVSALGGGATRTVGEVCEVQKLTPPVPKINGSFGFGLAVNGFLMAVGEPAVTEGAPGPGTVYLYQRGAMDWGSVTV